jgi:hypothetical protein
VFHVSYLFSCATNSLIFVKENVAGAGISTTVFSGFFRLLSGRR